MSGAHQLGDAIAATRFVLLSSAGEELGSFGELVELTSHAGADPLAKKLPGKRKPPTLTLKRGKTQSLEMWTWQQAAQSGRLPEGRRDCSLVMYAAVGRPVARYHLEQAWPSTLQIGSLTAAGATVLTETVTLSCRRIQRVAT